MTSGYSPSRWYRYEKKITVIDKGKVLTDFKSKYIFYYQIIAMNQHGDMYYDNVGQENIFARKADVIERYEFNAKDIKSNYTVKDSFLIGHSQSHAILKYDVIDQQSKYPLPFYDPKTAKYEITDLSDSTLEFLQGRDIAYLKEADKLKAQDIMKLKQLTKEQKQELIRVHEAKTFNPAYGE